MVYRKASTIFIVYDSVRLPIVLPRNHFLKEEGEKRRQENSVGAAWEHRPWFSEIIYNRPEQMCLPHYGSI